MVPFCPNSWVVAYMVIAVGVSLYQAYRGFMFQWILGIEQIKDTTRRVLLLCLADMFTYLVCTLSGFLALLLLFHFALRDRHLPASAGEATWLIFLALYGVLGVTGKLPDMLTRMKIPGAGD
jgi:hypothetical protein